METKKFLRKIVTASILGCVLFSFFYFFTNVKSDSHNSTTEKKCMDIYDLKLGVFNITAVCDGHIDIDPNNLITVDDNGTTHPFTPQKPKKEVIVPINVFLIKTDSHLILVDSGYAGADNSATGLLENCLHKAGYSPDQVTAVLITHNHEDHTSGLLTHDGNRAFINATVYVSAQETGAERILAPYKVQRFADGQQLFEGITALATPGHTAGHTSYMLASEGKKLLLWGDLLHRVDVQFANPEIAITFDSDPQQAIATRKSILAQVATEHIIVGGAHLPFPGLGYIQKSGASGYVWVPLTQPEITKK